MAPFDPDDPTGKGRGRNQPLLDELGDDERTLAGSRQQIPSTGSPRPTGPSRAVPRPGAPGQGQPPGHNQRPSGTHPQRGYPQPGHPHQGQDPRTAGQPARPSAAHPHHQQPQRPSGQFSAQQPLRPSGQFSAQQPVRPSGQFSAQQPVRPTGQVPSGGGGQPSGGFPSASQQAGPRQSGSVPAVGQPVAGGFHQSGKFAAAAPPPTAAPPSSRGPNPFAESVTDFHAMDGTADAGASPKKQIGLAVIASVSVGVVAWIVVSYLTVDRWLSPAQALTWMAVGTYLPTLIIGLLLTWPSDQKLTRKLAIAGAAPGLIVSTAAVFLASFWAWPAVRANLVPMGADEAIVVDKILNDSSREVAVAGCKLIASRHESPRWRATLMSVLTVRPILATECLAQADAEVQAALAPSLADRWSRQLGAEGEGLDEDLMCSMAASMPRLPVQRVELDARLLYCTLSAPTEHAQRCCGTALAATVSNPQQWVSHVEDTIGWVRDDQMVVGIFSMAFHQKGLTAPQMDFAKQVKFDGAQAQRVALAFSCDSIVHGNLAAVSHVGATLEGRCEIDVSELPQSRAIWSEICRQTLFSLQSAPDEPIDTLCEMTRDTLVSSAIETAGDLVRLASEKDVASKMSDSIDQGYDQVLEYYSSPDGIIEGAPGWIPAEDVERMRGQVRFR